MQKCENPRKFWGFLHPEDLEKRVAHAEVSSAYDLPRAGSSTNCPRTWRRARSACCAGGRIRTHGAQKSFSMEVGGYSLAQHMQASIGSETAPGRAGAGSKMGLSYRRDHHGQ
jgi:hypothetical protein